MVIMLLLCEQSIAHITHPHHLVYSWHNNICVQLIPIHNLDYHRIQLSVTPTGRRASTVRQYLRRAMNRPNLHVVTNAHVTKVNIVPTQSNTNPLQILFDETKTVTGVMYTHG